MASKNSKIASGSFYKPDNKPTWEDVGGNDYISQDDKGVDWLKLGTNKNWLRVGNKDGFGGLAPIVNGGSNLGANDLLFKEAWVNSYRGDSVNVAGGITGSNYMCKAGDYLLSRPDTTGGWARGMVVRNTAGTTSIGGAGWLGTGADNSATHYAIGFGSADWWDSSATAKFYPNGDCQVRGIIRGSGYNFTSSSGCIDSGHKFHNFYPGTQTCYLHFYPTSTISGNSRAELRVKSTAGSYKTLSFDGDGSITWNGSPLRLHGEVIKLHEITSDTITRSGEEETLMDIINELRNEIDLLKSEIELLKGGR